MTTTHADIQLVFNQLASRSNFALNLLVPKAVNSTGVYVSSF